MDYIKNRSIKNNRKEDISSLIGFEKAAWMIILSIYKDS